MADKPAFGTLLIRGVGLIGGSLGMAALANGAAEEVVGIGRDQDAEQMELALRLGAITRYELSGQDDTAFYDACAEADLIALCTPVAAILRDLPGVLASARADSVITDVGSVKSPIIAAAGSDPRFVGSHPMTGSERAGVAAARADLFTNSTWAVVPTEASSQQATERVEQLARLIGAIPRTLSAERHDTAVALTSHLPHILAFTLMALAGEQAKLDPDIPFLAAGSFASATRVAASQPAMWSEIAAQNQGALAETLRAYRRQLDHAQSMLDHNDIDGLAAIFEAGFQARNDWTQ